MKNKIEFLNMIKKIGISYDQFNRQANESANFSLNPNSSDHEKLLHGYTQLNQKRTTRILKTFKVSEETFEVISNISSPQTWLIITEDWCGDSAQNIPYLYKISEPNKNIELKIILRDKNLDIMDKFLTNGGRSIPKIIGFDSNGNQLFQWGPRPKVAKQLVNEWKENGLTKEEFNEKLHLWYGKDRGKTFEKEFVGLLSTKKVD